MSNKYIVEKTVNEFVKSSPGYGVNCDFCAKDLSFRDKVLVDKRHNLPYCEDCVDNDKHLD